MRLLGHIKPPQLPYQPVHVYVNGQFVASWQVSELANFSAIIPASFVSSPSLLIIDLHTPLAISPATVTDSPDQRRLGIACEEMQITEGIDPSATEPPVALMEATPLFRNEEWQHQHERR
jgi:hypothetical protein